MSGNYYGSSGEYRGRGDESGSFWGSSGQYEGSLSDGDGGAFGIFKGLFG